VVLDGRGKAHFLDGDDLLIFANLTLALGLFEAELAVVHQLAHRRTRLRRDLHQIELALLGQSHRLRRRHDAELFAVLIHHSNFAVADFLINHEIVDRDAPPVFSMSKRNKK